MNNQDRLKGYVKTNYGYAKMGFARLTGPQLRRLVHKNNRQVRKDAVETIKGFDALQLDVTPQAEAASLGPQELEIKVVYLSGRHRSAKIPAGANATEILDKYIRNPKVKSAKLQAVEPPK